jgi:LemA protein
METTNIFILVSAFIFIVMLWVIVVYRHFKGLQIGIKDQWEVLDEVLRKRHNLLPNLIETVRLFAKNQEAILEQLIDERKKAALEYLPGIKKIELEHDLSKTIYKVIDFGKTYEDLSKDTNFLELRKEINDLEQNIEVKSKKYNEMVRHYNNHRKLVFLSPISYIFGFKVEDIFEFEV